MPGPYDMPPNPYAELMAPPPPQPVQPLGQSSMGGFAPPPGGSMAPVGGMMGGMMGGQMGGMFGPQGSVFNPMASLGMQQQQSAEADEGPGGRIGKRLQRREARIEARSSRREARSERKGRRKARRRRRRARRKD